MAQDPADDDLRRAEWMETSSLEGALTAGGPLVLLAWPLTKLASMLRAAARRRRAG